MRILAVTCLVLAAFVSRAQPVADCIEYINTHKELAMEEMKRTGIPAAIKLAQGIHETAAGKSELVRKSNNHFGIKCKSYWTGGKVYHDDDARGECFRKYNSSTDSYRDHSDFLRAGQRYAFLFDLDPTDYKGWATGLRKAGYATNPKYAPILIRIIEEYNLQQYTLIAMGRMKPEEEVLAKIAPKPALEVPVLELPVESDAAEIAALDVPAPPADPQPVTSLNDDYPAGAFFIENTRVVYAKQGTSLLSIAQQYDIPLHKLLTFNNMKGQDVLTRDQVVFLQKKKKLPRNKI